MVQQSSKRGGEMLKLTCVSIITLALVFPLCEAAAAESKELRKQRQEVQKERQEKKKQRAAEIAEATKSFQEFARNLKAETQEKVEEFDVEFELKRVELKADESAKVAVAEAEYQKKVAGLFMKPGVQFDAETTKKMQADGKAYADELFVLQKESAEVLHKEMISSEKRKNELLTQMDQLALEKAASLGLMKEYDPILATPLGDGLTKQEEQWNDREYKEVAKIKERNQYTISEFEYGATLRAWEIKNREEDFELTWQEKAEEHALGAEQMFYNSLLMQSGQDGAVAQQEFLSRLAELNKETQLIKIKYKKISDQNRIKRREEKKKIQGR